jgi:hypothetical protein
MNTAHPTVSWWSCGSRAILALLVCLGAAAGCYRTTDLATEPAPETRVVAQLSPVGAEQLAPLIGADALGVEAEVVSWGSSGAELALLRVDHRGRSVLWNRERVVFPAGTLRDVQERRLDTTRTALFAGGVTTVAAVLGVAFIRYLFVADEGPGNGPDPVH